MHAFKFRVTSDENDEFYREIEVLANQTFEDFHKTLVTTCKFSGKELASFYLCDNQWRKRREITLEDMNIVDGEEQQSEPNLIMKNAKLNQIINDPHQKMLYVYDYMNMYTVSIELIKISAADLTIPFPRVLKEISDIIAPVTKSVKIVDEEEVFDEDDLKINADEEEEEDEDMGEEEAFYDDEAPVK